MITYEEIRKNEDIRTYIQSADEALAALGFTEHSFAHVTKVAESVKYILETLGFSAHSVFWTGWICLRRILRRL